MNLQGFQSLGKMKVKVAQSCLTLCNPMNYTVYEILQARILKWGEALANESLSYISELKLGVANGEASSDWDTGKVGGLEFEP